jgi:AcrR family transcriptional regulator
MDKRRKAAQEEGGPAYTNKREELIRAAARIFNEKGFEATNLNDIAEEFQTDRASLYYYVGSKEELFQEVFRSTASQVLDANIAAAKQILRTDRAPDEKLRLLIEQLLTSYEDSYPYVYVYIQEDMGKAAHQKTAWAREMARKTRRFESMVAEVIEAGIADGTFREDVPVPLMTNAIHGMINWTHRWFKPDGQFHADSVSEAFSSLFFQGVLRPAAVVPLTDRAAGKRSRARRANPVGATGAPRVAEAAG